MEKTQTIQEGRIIMAEMINDKTMDEIEILAKLHLTDEEKEHLIMTTDQLDRYRQTHPMVQNFSPSAAERHRRRGVFEELKSRWSR